MKRSAIQVKNRQSDKDTYSDHHTNRWLYAVHIGLFAGLIWGSIRWMFYSMKFTTELPGFLMEPFFRHHFLISYWGIVIGIAGFIVFSIAAALLYTALLGRFRGPWPGIFYGLGWWALMFLAAGPLIGMTSRVNAAGWNTILSELCIFTLWGVFIGYSIAFEFTDESSREPATAK
ncbi:YqhR family membrane protein [Paenibacillus sp. PAMC21692]|uniref:YqhR family membrane protein n=1 Tax=Paenibacillus sp. PAMC21692 TaxID=2762320 RepID=UPI00164ED7DB|nr:YqhR family membrane protein [Paenibacillus sp. PAMC21692]QNK55469.1 hypothetical protein H7F31_23045 [Paenibacillus sp. PAMC21692]